MAFLILGLALLAMKIADFGPVAGWSWWMVLAPFAAATLWWAFADKVGLTQRRAIRKMEQRKTERREKALDNLGLADLHKRHQRAVREGARSLETASPPDRKSRP